MFHRRNSYGFCSPGAIMSFNDQNRACHAERSEASPYPSSQTLRFAQGDTHCCYSIYCLFQSISSQTLRFAQGDTPVLPILVGKTHNRGPSINWVPTTPVRMPY